jgi:hypothetical protein
LIPARFNGSLTGLHLLEDGTQHARFGLQVHHQVALLGALLGAARSDPHAPPVLAAYGDGHREIIGGIVIKASMIETLMLSLRMMSSSMVDASCGEGKTQSARVAR